jgi:hypothetical protein
MSEQELMLIQVGQVLSRVARPHRCDETIPIDVQAHLWQLGLPCDEATSREDVIARLWARKRTLQVNHVPTWNSPGPTPPAAA